MTVNTAAVKTIIAETGDFIRVLYGNPQSHHVLEEGREAVTIADVEGERQLVEKLTALVPGSIGIGEEDLAMRAKTGLPEPYFTADDTVWFIDPIDGTQSFKNQRDDFGIMVGLQQKGVLTHGWIYFPIKNEWLEGEVGAGAYINGSPVKLRAGVPLEESSICIDNYHFPARTTPVAERADVLQEEAVAIAESELNFWRRLSPSYSCNEARMLLTSEAQGLFHANGLVWDNAAKVAIYRAAGGTVRLLKGDDYMITSPCDVRMQRRGLLYAPSPQDWESMLRGIAPLHGYFARRGLT
jgi:fructose-1,6-bisphosphatase/inositol monophosphatase family enzyme